MTGESKYSSATQALKKLELIPLSEKRKINEAVLVKKSLAGKAPSNIQLMYNNQKSKKATRAAQRDTLNLPKHKLNQYQQGPFYSSLKTWNTIPYNLRENDLSHFKSRLQRHVTTEYLNS